ncbi:2-oxoglutarate and iron-dependent oxygenase domain-containing protein 2 isoform X1 [Dipodomys spectabilis]|uniref:2-oxoglutarate and iron-dependent oxygenase domain-containing protein 2 isoform X1 n=1 Tax=Dipodomys spectabilis TaxID=105255 RepID=UPI001C549E9A|nr:2-oxoglutarate and iron-dependent oxygenase domain-containing protein 2 isoform X1 [Dipodomys spectabilis]
MATPGAPRRFCRCACFCSENLYVARYGLHLRFRSEQQLRRDYGALSEEEKPRFRGVRAVTLPSFCSQILRSRGCVSSRDFQRLREELEQEVERRRQLGQKSAARRALIASSYHPARPEIYSSLQDAALAPEFLAASEYSASPGADLKGLLQRLETVSEEKRIYRVPVFTASFCQALLEELEHFEQSDMPKGRPNTMNNYGMLMSELGLDEPLVTPLRERFLQPLMALLFPEYGGGCLDSHRAFVVKYALGQDLELGCHYDNAELTLNVALGKAFTGGALYFGGLFQAPTGLTQPLEVEHVVGQGVLHRGAQLHGARPLRTGERWNLVVWLRASAVRNHLCPMCCQKPDLVDDEGFGDGFTRDEPPTVDVCALT